MNDIRIFSSPEFGAIRTTTIDGEPWFMLTDVCRVLEIRNSRQAKSRLTSKGVISNDTLTAGGVQTADFVNESNLYKLIFQSRKLQAEKFSEWVTSEVLPSIRKNGGYVAGQERMSNEELMAKALLMAQRTIENREAEIEVLKPKAFFADAVSGSKTSILVRDLAKLITQNGGKDRRTATV